MCLTKPSAQDMPKPKPIWRLHRRLRSLMCGRCVSLESTTGTNLLRCCCQGLVKSNCSEPHFERHLRSIRNTKWFQSLIQNITCACTLSAVPGEADAEAEAAGQGKAKALPAKARPRQPAGPPPKLAVPPAAEAATASSPLQPVWAAWPTPQPEPVSKKRSRPSSPPLQPVWVAWPTPQAEPLSNAASSSSSSSAFPQPIPPPPSGQSSAGTVPTSSATAVSASSAFSGWMCVSCGNQNSKHFLQCSGCAGWRPLGDDYRPQRGDWICGSCSNHNYGSAKRCKWVSCHTRDWTCPQCGNLNYASRKECHTRNCRLQKPV
jgi:hypothetical protein